jgi:hypothetical protein
MALYSTLASLSQTAASNAADGSVDAPSTIDQQTNLLASFIAQLRDGKGFTTGAGYLGQCRLTKSGANLLLSPYNGNGLTINGVAYAIPSAGVTLAPTALAVGTTFYIYAYMSAGTMTLEASATGHATDTTTGIEIKSGDATRTLVGLARTITGPAWVDSATQRFVISWFNRRPIQMNYSSGVDFSSSSGSNVQINTYQLLEFLCWGDMSIRSWANLPISHSAANALVNTGIGLDTTSSTNVTNAHVWQAYAASANGAASPFGEVTPSEGYHYLAPVGATSAASATWKLGGTIFASVFV